MNKRLNKLKEILFKSKLDAIALVPGANFRFITGGNFAMMERPTVIFISKSTLPLAILPTLEVESFGAVEEVKPVMLSVLKGILRDITDIRINYVNVLNIAEERGISLKFSYNTSFTPYSNLIKAKIKTENGTFSVEGCVFDKKVIKLTKIMEYQIDVSPNSGFVGTS